MQNQIQKQQKRIAELKNIIKKYDGLDIQLDKIDCSGDESKKIFVGLLLFLKRQPEKYFELLDKCITNNIIIDIKKMHSTFITDELYNYIIHDELKCNYDVNFIMLEKEVGNLWKNMEIQPIDLSKKILKEKPEYFKYLKVQTEELCLIAIIEDKDKILHDDLSETEYFNRLMTKYTKGKNLKYVKDQTKLLCFQAIRQSYSAIKYIRKPTKEMYLLAIEQNGLAIQYIPDDNEWIDELCYRAVSNNYKALEFVKVQTLAIINKAITVDKRAIEYVNHIQLKQLLGQ